MRSLVLILFGLALLVAQSAAATLLPLHEYAPNLLLPIVIFLGVSHEVPVARGAVLSFVLGYFLDAFCGSSMGLHTFILVATFMAARGAGLRLFFRGPAFQMVLTLVVSLAAGGAILALRAIFEKPAPFPTGHFEDVGWRLLGSSAFTALCAPLIFASVRRIEGLFTPRREEGAASA
jgi:rod shape-determining protein MreD